MAQQVQRERHWLWSADAEDGYGFERAFSEAKFWACGVYARACDRLRTAAAGNNAASIHNPPCINTDCLQIAACCPFYGCFIGKLQQRVRLYYGIDGCDWDDFWDACCCPCLTLVRSEQEIILRERLANDPNGCDKAYQRSGPMVSTYTSPNVCCQCDNGCLPFCCSGDPDYPATRVQEKGPTASAAAFTATSTAGQRPATKPATAPVSSHPRQAPGTINLRNLHALDNQPVVIPEQHTPAHNGTAHRGKLGEHARAFDAGRDTPTAEGHRLEEDVITTRRLGTPRHELRDDPLTPTHGARPAPHTIHHDPLIRNKHNHGAEHTLESDPSTATRGGHGGHGHTTVLVDEDTTVSSRGPRGNIHFSEREEFKETTAS